MARLLVRLNGEVSEWALGSFALPIGQVSPLVRRMVADNPRTLFAVGER